MDGIYNLKERLCEELEEIGRKPTWDAGDLELVDKLAHAMKNIVKIIEHDEMEEYGSNNDGGGYGARYDGYSIPMNNGAYSANNYGRNDRYSRSGRYSRYSMGGRNIADELREVMYDIHNESARNSIQRIIDGVTSGQIK